MEKTILQNWKFLITETQEQCKLTYGLLNEFSHELLDKIESKDDYIDNLKTMIENHCFSRIHGYDYISQEEINYIRAIHIICVNLERIADFCVNICRQMEYLTDTSFIHQYDYKSMFSEIQTGLEKIVEVLEEKNLSGALTICRCEFILDQLYKSTFDRIRSEMQENGEIPNLITVLFIYRYLERIGDAILNIGEALIFLIIGDRIKIRQFEALEKTLAESGFQGTLNDIDFNSIWGNRSGCRISRVSNKRPSSFKAQGIFKEGAIKKIKKEEKNLRLWESLFPRLTPRIFGYYEKGETASLLIEFLPGCTLDQVILTADDDIVQNALFVFEQTMLNHWETTKKNEPVKTDYIKQLRSRIDSVFRVHPNFFRPRMTINACEIQSTEDILTGCDLVDSQISAPFSILIHGDFNINNIVYDHEEQRVYYIDLYRSKQMDYIQDASVFLVSNFRLPVFEKKLRKRINHIIDHFYDVFSQFAQKHHDDLFTIRMALGLTRSLYTSSRFELNEVFAKEMYLKAHYLMDCIVNYKKDWNTFQFPRDVIQFHGE